jgi:tRNA-dihydrouridine synthase A
MAPSLSAPLSIAPMIDWTYVHFRVFMRLLAPNALLYTEMQTPGAIVHNPKRALAFHSLEQPLLALQLGGADKKALVESAKIAEQHGFQEINLNLGCPSDRVQAGRFGACLMSEPAHVADCISALKHAVAIPVTAKTRIGIDHQDSYEFFASFAHHLVNAGADKLIIHARKAWLNGLSPKQNRTIPPVNYNYVYELKKELSTIPITINGNINTLEEINTHLEQVDGVMLGRLAYQNPYAIACIHHSLYPETSLPSRYMLLMQYLEYLQSIDVKGIPLSLFTKPILNMTHGVPHARICKEELLNAQRSGEIKILFNAIERLSLDPIESRL